MKVKTVLSLFILAAFFGSTALLAQPAEGKNAQLYMFWEIVVHPDKVAQFEEAAKKQVAFYKKHDFAHGWSTSSTNDGHYYYGIPIDNYGMMDTVMEAFGKMEKELGEEAKALEMAFEGTVAETRSFVWSLDYDRSYMPENPRIKPEEQNFADWLFVYFKPGTEEKVQELNKKFKALAESKSLNHPYQVWVGDFGTEAPVHCYVDGGKDAVDYHTQWAELEKIMGKEQEELWAEMAKYIRKTEHYTGRPRPDLSMIPFSQRRPTT